MGKRKNKEDEKKKNKWVAVVAAVEGRGWLVAARSGEGVGLTRELGSRGKMGRDEGWQRELGRRLGGCRRWLLQWPKLGRALGVSLLGNLIYGYSGITKMK